ncbi:MAG: amino acid ABC transporter substrate-binding protein [Gammaproteobacteria bacterium]|nr:MAG: amino acid ABC transporter substrate-binding protein [Gammaproteobacteria bacterium]
MKKIVFGILFIGVGMVNAAYAGTLDSVKEKGMLNCGATQGVVGFSVPDENNRWTGFDVDFCRAVAAAIFNDPDKVKFVPLSGKERFTALQSGEIDLLSRITTDTMSRDTTLGLNFIDVMYYDGQGLMVRKTLGVKDGKELSGATVCTDTGTTTELNLADFFKANKLEYKPVVFEKVDEQVAAYDAGRCDVLSTDISGLQAYRAKLKNPDENMVLPNVISKEPLAPVVRQGDDGWQDLVRWTRNCIINAEELGVTSKNVAEMKKSTNPAIKRLLGVEGEFGKSVGLSEEWCANAIEKVGNYGEIYDRNLGPKAQISIKRGLNNLWNNGGILYAAPIR